MVIFHHLYETEEGACSKRALRTTKRSVTVGINSFCLFFVGQEFLVMHNVSEPHSEDLDVAFLCLLCKRTLSNKESFAHVFSREHVRSFLVSIFIRFFQHFPAVSDCNILIVVSGS